jgi:hypothetical protein
MKRLHIYYFSGLIICHQCGEYFRALKERSISKYVCSRYSNRKGCSRNIINEEQILELVITYCSRKNIPLELSNQFMVNIIDRIIVKDSNNFDVFYKDNTHQFISDNGIKFI